MRFALAICSCQPVYSCFFLVFTYSDKLSVTILLFRVMLEGVITMRISDLTGSGGMTMDPSQNRLMLLLLAVVVVVVGVLVAVGVVVMGHHQLSVRQMKVTTTTTTTTVTVTATIKKRDKRIVLLKMVARLVRKDLRQKRERI